jgi:hypothetical protein
MVQEFLFQLLRYHLVGRRFDRERRQMAGRHAAFQPGLAEAGDGGREDQHFRQHDEQDGHHQQLGRQAAAKAAQSHGSDRRSALLHRRTAYTRISLK